MELSRRLNSSQVPAQPPTPELTRASPSETDRTSSHRATGCPLPTRTPARRLRRAGRPVALLTRPCLIPLRQSGGRRITSGRRGDKRKFVAVRDGRGASFQVLAGVLDRRLE